MVKLLWRTGSAGLLMGMGRKALVANMPTILENSARRMSTSRKEEQEDNAEPEPETERTEREENKPVAIEILDKSQIPKDLHRDTKGSTTSQLSRGQKKAISRLFSETDDEETLKNASLVGSVIHLPRKRDAKPKTSGQEKSLEQELYDVEEGGGLLVSEQMRKNGCTHIEITPEHVLIEFESGFSPGYQNMASLSLLTDEELEESGVPSHMVPSKLENRTCLGAGATIYLDRKKVARNLSLLSRGSSSPPLSLAFQSDLDSAVQTQSDPLVLSPSSFSSSYTSSSFSSTSSQLEEEEEDDEGRRLFGLFSPPH